MPRLVPAPLYGLILRLRVLYADELRDLLLEVLQAPMDCSAPAAPSACDLLADLVGCCEGAPADLSSRPEHLAGFGER